MLLNRFIVLIVSTIIVTGCAASTRDLDQKRSTQAEVHYKLGISHLQSNNPTSALKEFLQAVENDPENSSIQVALAQAYQLKKAYPEAERHYLKGLALSDNDPRYLNNLAALYLDMENWEKAIAYFDQAAADLLFLRPYVAITGKGYAYYRMKNYPAALRYLQEALGVAPGYARAHFLKSEVYRDMGEIDLSRKSLEQAIDVAPNYVQARYQLGVLLLKEQELTAAKAEFSHVVELAPSSEYGLKAAEMLRSLPES